MPSETSFKNSLRVFFHHHNFRPGQLATTLAATHRRDVFVRMATGGKSLLFLGPLAISDTLMGVFIGLLIGLMSRPAGEDLHS